MTVQTRRLTDPADLAALDPLYRAVFGGGDGVNLRLVVGISANGGHVIGGYEDGRLVGFGISFLARDRPGGRLYQYSQTVAVAADARGRGVGRAVKYAQRDAALADGIDLMRWSFDPLHARNGHFNLDVLGGRARRLHPNFYGDAPPDRDAGEATDRLVVDWELASPARAVPSVELPPLAAGESREIAGATGVAVPAEWARFRDEHGPSAAAQLRKAVVEAMLEALDGGREAASCRRISADVAAYLFVPA